MIIRGTFEGGFPYGMATTPMQHHARAVQHNYTNEQYGDRSGFYGRNGAVAPSTPTPTVTSAGRHLLCGYPSKICTNERAWKRDGSLHRFCEEHRQRANTNQKRWAKRKTRTKTGKSNSTAAAAATAAATEDYQVEDSMLQAQAPMDMFDFDMTLESLIRDAKFWSPTGTDATSRAATQWIYSEESTQNNQDEDELEAELWAALGLGNINIAL